MDLQQEKDNLRLFFTVFVRFRPYFALLDEYYVKNFLHQNKSACGTKISLLVYHNFTFVTQTQNTFVHKYPMYTYISTLYQHYNGN